MDEATARDRLATGLARLTEAEPGFQRREDYYNGIQDLPFAPEGVNAEYLRLREMAIANWISLAADTPVQRLRPEGFRTGRDQDADEAAWDEVWQANDMDARQRVVYTQMMVHRRGLMSVWPNAADPKSPIVRPESVQRVHLEPDPADPFTNEWAVKAVSTEILRSDVGVLSPVTVHKAWVYDRSGEWVRFEREGAGRWEIAAGGNSGLGDLPFVPFDTNLDGDGKPRPSIVEQLIPSQDAINTIRFNALLAMQFSAYRQRVFTGFDPVVKDDQGNTVWVKDADGNVLLDEQGQPQPVVVNMGRVSVDRALVFPGEDTKVFDLPESNLDNYITVLSEFLTHFFAIGQIPPQYLLNRMANLSGDALDGAESTLASLLADLQRWSGDSLKKVMRLASKARGEEFPDLGSEVLWADSGARSFAQLVDGIQKLIASGFPREAAFEMLPAMTPQKLRRVMEQVDAEATDVNLANIAREFNTGAIGPSPAAGDLNAGTAGAPAAGQ